MQVLEASVTGLKPGKQRFGALDRTFRCRSPRAAAGFWLTRGFAIVNAIGPIRQVVRDRDKSQRRYLVIAPGKVGNLGAPVQAQSGDRDAREAGLTREIIHPRYQQHFRRGE